MRRLLFAIFFFAASGLEAQQSQFDPTNFIVVGGGLSAGFADFRLIDQFQKNSYPALMATQMRTIFPLPLIRDGGPVVVTSFDPVPGVLPKSNQSVLRALPFPLFAFNLSIPFVRVSESLQTRPSTPLVVEGDARRTLANLILGYPASIFEKAPLWTQVEYAEMMAPTFAIVEMGSGDVLDAALSGNRTRITPVDSFTRDYTALVTRMRNTNGTILLMSVPDPTDFPYFSGVQNAAQLYGADATTLASRFALNPLDLVTLGGLVEIGDRLRGRRSGPLSDHVVLRAATAAAIRESVQGYNSAIASVASSNGLRVFDLNGFIKEVRDRGVQAGSSRVGGGFQQGFYSKDALFPTPTAHAVLANRLLEFINSAYRTSFPLVDVDAVARRARSTVPLGPGFETLLKVEK
ncbi:MAG: hypothetical protein HY315_10945 [Acidobacteria bacterium]|nr:hypothetical protein [Acidobacteriota bacterium]